MMFPGRSLVRIALALSLGASAAACTRSVELTQTPLMPPVIAPTQVGQVTTSISLPTAIPEGEAPASAALATDSPGGAEPERKYAVVFLADGEVLNVRSGPGVTNEVVASLPANAHDLLPTGLSEDVDGVSWIEIGLPEGGAGWVSSKFLTEQTTAAQVCNDPQVGVLLDQLSTAVREQDGHLLSTLISPLHGLAIHHNNWNPGVVFDDPQVVTMLFGSTVDYDWGFHEASGEPLVGPFKDLILPKLENVLLQSHTRNCNTLERGVATGSTTGYVYWPYDYASLSYIALFRPAPPEQEQDWRTWVAGIEYVEGKAYLAVLIQFYWEI